jgi:hypothetical protein
MKTFFIVDKISRQVMTRYQSEAANQAGYGGPWGDPNATEHIECPESVDPRLIASVSEEGSFQASQASRNEKLARLRAERDAKLQQCDVMINDIALGERSDVEAVKAYRQALKDITTQFKKVDGQAKATIDSADFDSLWPEAPQAE